MSDILSTGVSALLAFQRALDTTSHNIANANTDGYSRQLVDFATRPPQLLGSNWIGNGVDVASIRRLFDQTLSDQQKSASSSLQQLDVMATYAGRLDKLFSDDSTGLSASLQQFTNSIETLSTSPSSTTARQVVLSQAQNLVNRLKALQGGIDTLGTQMSSQLGAEVNVVNSLTAGIVDLNQQIVAAQGSSAQRPNDLLDKRDQLLAQLSSHIGVKTITEDNGAISVFIGSGQALVSNTRAGTLALAPGDPDLAQQRIMLTGFTAPTDISQFVSGGTLGGLMQLRSDLLTPAQNSLGQVAAAVATLTNLQNAAGLDLNGNFGGPLFALSAPSVISSNGNTGTASLAATRSNIAAISTSDLTASFDGSAWKIVHSESGAAVPMTGVGTSLNPFVAEGVSIVVSGTAQAGDRFLIRPTHDAVASLNILISSPAQVAAAAPVLTSVIPGNAGNGSIDAGAVLTPGSWVRGSYNLKFTSTSNWQITDSSNAVVATGAYVPGGNIDFNGMRVQVSGAPAAGDSFKIADNSNGIGDGRNARALVALLNSPALFGGTASATDAAGRLVGEIGVKSSQASIGRDAQSTALDDATAALQSSAGVNLDEEAANLLRYQQAYQAAARVIAAANAMFDTLIQATRR
jgi:flagellar hook-associated protein 1 FlgK